LLTPTPSITKKIEDLGKLPNYPSILIVDSVGPTSGYIEELEFDTKMGSCMWKHEIRGVLSAKPLSEKGWG